MSVLVSGPWMLDALAAAWLLLGVAVVAWGWWSSRRLKTPHCPQCGYDLRGQPPERALLCPECGFKARTPGELLRPRKAGLKRWSAVAIALILFLAPATLVLYVVIGWQREQAIVAEIEARHPGDMPSTSSRWIAPEWLFSRLPARLARYGQRIYGFPFYLGGSRLLPPQPWDDTDVAHLSGLKSLRWLELSNSRVTDAGLVHLSGLESLRDLSLSHTRVTDAGLAHLAGLKSLQLLRLDGTQVTDAGLAALRKQLPGCTIYPFVCAKTPPETHPCSDSPGSARP